MLNIFFYPDLWTCLDPESFCRGGPTFLLFVWGGGGGGGPDHCPHLWIRAWWTLVDSQFCWIASSWSVESSTTCRVLHPEPGRHTYLQLHIRMQQMFYQAWVEVWWASLERQVHGSQQSSCLMKLLWAPFHSRVWRKRHTRCMLYQSQWLPLPVYHSRIYKLPSLIQFYFTWKKKKLLVSGLG